MIRAAIVMAALPAFLTAQQSPPAAPASPPPAAPVYTAAWTAPVEGAGSLRLAIGQHSVFLAHGGGITAYARTDGKTLWTREIAGVTGLVSASRADAPVVAVTATEVVALDPGTSQERFRAAVAEEAAPTLIAFIEGDLLTVASGQNLRAYRRDGAVAWSVNLPSAAVTPVVPQKTALWIGTSAPALVALDPASGAVTRQISLETPARTIVTTPDEVYVAAAKPALARFRTGDTNPSWRWTRGLSELVGGPVVGDKVLYIAALDNTMQEIDRGSGSVKWRKPVPSRPAGGPREAGRFLVVPLISGDVALLDPATRAFGQFANLKLESDARLQDFGMDEAGTIYTAAGSMAGRNLTAWRAAAPAK